MIICLLALAGGLAGTFFSLFLQDLEEKAK